VERQIKGWRRAKKLALVRGDLDALRQLADTRANCPDQESNLRAHAVARHSREKQPVAAGRWPPTIDPRCMLPSTRHRCLSSRPRVEDSKMKDGERLVRWLTFQDVDRPPFYQFFLGWDSTHERWWHETGIRRLNLQAYFNLDFGLENVPIRLGMVPAFKREVVEEQSQFYIERDERGILMRQRRDRGSMPGFLEHPVKGWDDWEQIKKRFDPDSPERYDVDWGAFNGYLEHTGAVANLGYVPYGVFGTPRDLMGAEEVLISFAAQPDLVHDMMDHLTDFWIRIYDRVSEHVKISCIHMWEDMSGRKGSLISPRMVEDFMMPNYRKISEFAESKGIPLFSVDTDGLVDELLPPMTKAGVNMMFPFEVQAGCDIERYRREYPKLGIMGGLDKRALARDRDAIDRELAVAERMHRIGGYVANPDHAVPPDVPFENYRYFLGRLREMVGKTVA